MPSIVRWSYLDIEVAGTEVQQTPCYMGGSDELDWVIYLFGLK